MSDSAKSRTPGRPFRKAVWAAGLMALVAVAVALIVWGTQWTLPQAGEETASYELAGYWDGGDWPAEELLRPFGIAVAPNADVYVTDARKRVVRLGPDGHFKGQWGREGKEPGEFSNPVGIAVAADGSVFVSDHLFWLWPRPVSSDKGFNVPTGVAVDSMGLVHVADSGNHRVVMLSAKGEFLARWKIPDSAPEIHSPEKIAVAPDGRTVYATDLAADRILVLKVVPKDAQ